MPIRTTRTNLIQIKRDIESASVPDLKKAVLSLYLKGKTGWNSYYALRDQILERGQDAENELWGTLRNPDIPHEPRDRTYQMDLAGSTIRDQRNGEAGYATRIREMPLIEENGVQNRVIPDFILENLLRFASKCEDSFSCPICFGILAMENVVMCDPKNERKPCGHMLCIGCMNELIEASKRGGSELSCPICRRELRNKLITVVEEEQGVNESKEDDVVQESKEEDGDVDDWEPLMQERSPPIGWKSVQHPEGWWYNVPIEGYVALESVTLETTEQLDEDLFEDMN